MSMYYDTQIGFGGKLTKTIKYLIIIQTAIYLLQKLGLDNPIEHYLGLRANLCMNKGMIWQLLTYHLVPYGGFELFINAIILWMLGSEVEETLGTKYLSLTTFFLE